MEYNYESFDIKGRLEEKTKAKNAKAQEKTKRKLKSKGKPKSETGKRENERTSHSVESISLYVNCIPKERDATVESSCKLCSLYKREECLGNKGNKVCESYVPTPATAGFKYDDTRGLKDNTENWKKDKANIFYRGEQL